MYSHIKPDFIGIGAQKCASSWVYRVLKDHPEACLSNPKELHYFSYYYDRGQQWYQAHFMDKESAIISGELSTSYICDPRAPMRAYAYNPDLRIIVTLRDPVERAYSNHLHEIRINQYTGPDFSFDAGLKNNPMYLEQSRYSKHLKKWLEYFPADQMIILFLEEVKQDPIREVKRLYSFLGIDNGHESEFLFRKANTSHTIKNEAFENTLQLLGTVARGLGLSSLVRFIKGNAIVVSIRNSNTEHLSESIPVMTEDTKARLTEELSDDINELAKLLDKTYLPWPTWKRIKKT